MYKNVFLILSFYLSNTIYGFSSNINNLKNDEIQEIIFELHKPIFESGDCIKYNKNNETFWKNNETDTFKIIDIGNKYLKTQRIFYMKEDSNSWIYGDDIFLVEFSAQKKFSKTNCPDLNYKLSPNDISKKK